MSVERTFDLLERYAGLFNKEDALCCKQNGEWIKYSTSDYIEYSYNFSFGLLELGLSRDDKIMTVSHNRPEWNFIDMGMAMIGVVHVPVFTSLNSDEYHYVLTHSDARMLIVSDRKLFRALKAALSGIERRIDVYSFDEIEEIKSWKEIIEAGKAASARHRSTVEEIKRSVRPDDFASLIYTSGTTGRPKGAMLTHDGWLATLQAEEEALMLTCDDIYLGIYPMAHVGISWGLSVLRAGGTYVIMERYNLDAVSYTHLTLPTIYPV